MTMRVVSDKFYDAAGEAVAMWPEIGKVWDAATSRHRADWHLPVLVAESMGDVRFDAPAVMAAVGCMQLSIILIDGLLDQDDNGFHVEYGAGTAANMAAAFQALSVALLNQSSRAYSLKRGIATLTDIGLETSLGQHKDSLNPRDEDAYWELVRAKSGPFYSGVFSIGAIMNDANDMLVEIMKQFGALVGEMIQIRDDLTDSMAFPVAPDWKLGRSNLLILYGRIAEYEQRDRFISLCASIRDRPDSVTIEGTVTEAQQILIREGAVDYCLDLLKARMDDGIALLDKVDLGNKHILAELLKKLTQVISLD